MDANMLQVFIYENQQLVDKLESILLAAEGRCRLDNQEIDEIFRIMHTVKGASSMMELDNLAQATHAAEDLFSRLREHEAGAGLMPAIFDAAFGLTAFLNRELAKLSKGEASDAQANELIEQIAGLLNGFEASGAPEGAGSAPAAAVTEGFAAGGSDEGRLYKISLSFEAGCQMEHIRALGIIEALKPLCLKLAHLPSSLESESSREEIADHGLTIYVQAASEPRLLEAELEQTMFVSAYSLRPIEAESGELPASMGGRAAAASGGSSDAPAPSLEESGGMSRQSFISVRVSLLDRLLSLTGGIATAQSMLINSSDLEGLELENFRESAAQLKGLTSLLQDLIMSARMLPVSTLFHKMGRIVRDMSKKFDKEIELVLRGEETEADKSVIDQLSDPLMHIIRNSIDHGIEDRGIRELRGKNSVGRVTLEARATGNELIVTVSDDGGGLDREQIIKKAVEKGLINRDEREISDKEAYSLILLPGFSTKDSVSEYSGRGVGMDVAQKSLSRLGGSLSVDSRPGEGTVHTLKIPLTLTLVDGIKCQVSDMNFLLPTAAVLRTIKPNSGEIFTDPQGRALITVLGEICPIINLHDFFELEGESLPPEEGLLLLVESGGSQYCLTIDSIQSEEQAVVNKLPDYLQYCTTSLAGISGCTFLGDGSVNFILDVSEIVSLVRERSLLNV